MPSSTSDRIQALPVQLANQIAAGEVVERPASVVKELIENSIDAGASRIDIEIEEGGKRLVRVEDNGRGIHVDDFKLALTRHATSKLHELNDLHAINSLGFRGEALPSIASVCSFHLSSRYHGSDKAWQVSVNEQGRMSEIQQHAQPEGTTITVEQLFCNTPARRRFLRAAKTEFLHVQDVVMRAALSRFDIAFNLKHNGKPVLRLPAINDEGMQHRRLASVGGKTFQQSLLGLDEQRDGIRVHGWLAPAAAHRSQADRQFVFINGRMVRDKVLSHAIRQAYGNALPPGRYAMYTLYIELDPAKVDVNVHPTKHEVRFREVRSVHDVLFTAVQHGLAGEQQAIPQQAVAGLRESAAVYSINRQQAYVPQASTRQTLQGEVRSLLPGNYVLVELADAHWLYDLRAVARQVFSERLQRQQAYRGIISRPLLVPQRLELDECQVEWFDAVRDKLLALGIDITSSSKQVILVRALPEVFSQIDIENFVTQLARQGVTTMPGIIDIAVCHLSANIGMDDVKTLLAELVDEQHDSCRRQLTADDLHDFYHH